ncbi:hypothetical protein G17_00093 [Escherichia phage vB_EcoM_G17]|uniref:hypothetical protein n=1 Tax=Escherichia coli TaxID=562 RepID=UPI0010BA804D|nr:hypothetical protein [Escherichia coli]MED6971082.1 hypothetical protein [Escherichia coli O157]QBO61589.1 hypothetical protein G17_00093 [Escherichia phage vB_EcoM_G17]WNN14418.1 hypothetical protein Sharanji_gp130 [Escherichia phage Sharanji]EGE6126987.1 hypothetical protein [Escherichia coli]MCU6293975.1 hypothetical protein [Escherichia coli]
MKLSFIRLAEFFGTDVITLQQIADNTSLSTQEVLDLDVIQCDNTSIDFKEGLVEKDKIKAKINGAGRVQYWKGVLSNV